MKSEDDIRKDTLEECAAICQQIANYYGTQAEGSGDPGFDNMIAREAAAMCCKAAILKRLLV